MIETHKPASLTLRRAEIHQRLADLYASAARDADTQDKTVALVQATLKQGELAAPETLADKGAADAVKNYRTLAEAEFAAADADLLNVIQMPAGGELVKTTVTSARAARTIELYAHAQFLASYAYASPPDKDALEKQAANLMTEAKELVSTIQSGNAPLPSFLPAVLAPPPAPTTAPATPATAPATAPGACPALPMPLPPPRPPRPPTASQGDADAEDALAPWTCANRRSFGFTCHGFSTFSTRAGQAS